MGNLFASAVLFGRTQDCQRHIERRTDLRALRFSDQTSPFPDAAKAIARRQESTSEATGQDEGLPSPCGGASDWG